MSIPFKARVVDLANLVVAKGSNFLLTVALFALLGRGMNSLAFAEFGYWWSIAIMIGGVLLGGLSSALVRVAAVHGSLRHLAAPLGGAALALLALAAAFVLTLLVDPPWARLALLLGAVGLFGLSVQAQAALLALLRAAEATRANALSSLLIVLLVPLVLHLLLGPERGLPSVFLFLSCAFLAGTGVALASARGRLRHLAAAPAAPAPGVAAFVANATSFTAVNVFSYAIVNVDFTLFRFIGTPADFALMGTAKVFFERFVVPALMVFAGAISLMVLRHRQDAATVRLDARISPRGLAAALGLVVILSLAYRAFAASIRGDTATIALPWVACAAAGYLLYAVNGVLFDVLVVRRSLFAVATHVAAFLGLGAALQATAITTYGVPGWALAWLVFNLIVAVVLAREGLHLRLAGWTRRAPEDEVLEVR